MTPMSVAQAMELGKQHHRAGRLQQAEAIYRQILAAAPNHTDAMNLLGAIAHQVGRDDIAVELTTRAIALAPNRPEYHSNLGNALKGQGKFDEAIAAYRAAIRIGPAYAEAHYNLGNVLRAQGRANEAIAAYRAAIQLKPDSADAHCNLGIALIEQGQLDQAEIAYRAAIQFKPDYAEAHYNLGNLLKDQGQLEQAVAAYRTAIQLKPQFAAAHFNLGSTYRRQGRLDEAIASSRKSIELQSDARAYSNIAYTVHFHPDYGPAAILAENRRWADLFESPLAGEIRQHDNDRNPDRRLKVGYVSPDFREHVVGRFLLPLLPNHDPDQIELYGYADVRALDSFTQRLRQACHVWRNTTALSDAELAGQVRRDGIDILVDLTLHMDRNRLLAFARKPAPVQVTYLGYCSTTGLRSIDYRLSDNYLDPPGSGDQFYSEKTIRLPHCYWCYPRPDDSPAPGPLPASSDGAITFGCFNNFCKITIPTIECWIDLMHTLPNSRLFLYADQGDHRGQLCRRFAKAGVDPSRLRFSGFVPMRQYFQQYCQMDIALDPFPYGGGTTTCDALWMGVPVVTLFGDRAVGRGGVTLLSNAGLKEWIAQSTQEYCAIAQKWANDRPALADLRQDLRPRMLASPLMDGKRFTADVEAAYRQMWRAWCSTS